MIIFTVSLGECTLLRSFDPFFSCFLLEFQSQKRNSTDAGIQTDPLAGPAAAEKSKWKQNHQGRFSCTDWLSSPLSLSHPSIQSHSLWLNLFFVTLQTINRLWVNLSGGRVVESATVWKRHNCWEIYIFWRQKKTKTFFYRHLMGLSLCFSNLTCWGSAIDRSELLFLATNLSQTLKMCC